MCYYLKQSSNLEFYTTRYNTIISNFIKKNIGNFSAAIVFLILKQKPF